MPTVSFSKCFMLVHRKGMDFEKLICALPLFSSVLVVLFLFLLFNYVSGRNFERSNKIYHIICKQGLFDYFFFFYPFTFLLYLINPASALSVVVKQSAASGYPCFSLFQWDCFIFFQCKMILTEDFLHIAFIVLRYFLVLLFRSFITKAC